MNAVFTPSLFQACDFCQTQGILGRTILDREGWYFCRPCATEIDRELEKRRKEKMPGPKDPLPA
jgi:hypothetical protein